MGGADQDCRISRSSYPVAGLVPIGTPRLVDVHRPFYLNYGLCRVLGYQASTLVAELLQGPDRLLVRPLVGLVQDGAADLYFSPYLPLGQVPIRDYLDITRYLVNFPLARTHDAGQSSRGD